GNPAELHWAGIFLNSRQNAIPVPAFSGAPNCLARQSNGRLLRQHLGKRSPHMEQPSREKQPAWVELKAIDCCSSRSLQSSLHSLYRRFARTVGNEQDVISLQLQIVCFAGKNLLEINGRLLWPLVRLVDQLAAIEGGRGAGALRQSQRREK